MRLPLAALALALAAACSTPPPAPAAFAFRGTIAWEAHLARPHATSDVSATVTLRGDGPAARLEIAEDTPPGRPAPLPLAIVRDAAGACWLREEGEPRFRRDPGEGRRLLEVLLAAAAAGPAGESQVYTSAYQHPRLGDVADSAAWHAGPDGAHLDVVWHRATVAATFSLRAAPPPAPAAIAPAAEELDPRLPAASPTPARFRTLWPGVHEIVLPDADSRSLAIEFADHLVLCETSLDNPAGERLLAALDEHLPGKPVRFVLFGHYHPHYTGGLRPVMARGATVVAPPLGAAFAKEIAARPFRTPPDALAASGREVVVETFVGERRFADATNELVAFDIGPQSHHTDEYVVFWLPRQQVLFEGDLGWFAGPDGPRAGGRRARGLLEAIDERRLPVQTLVQGWPAVGSGTLPMAEFRQLLAK